MVTDVGKDPSRTGDLHGLNICWKLCGNDTDGDVQCRVGKKTKLRADGHREERNNEDRNHIQNGNAGVGQVGKI